MEHYYFLWACKGCYEQYSAADIKECRLCGSTEFIDLTNDEAAIKANIGAAISGLERIRRSE
jgi:rRNA maturation endonuclease Nob1